MYSIENNVTNEIIINKSRFITKIYKVFTLEEVNAYLENIKKEYKDATHYTYAYIIDNVKRFNDDKEPSGTAGMPILNVLLNNNLNYVLCIVIRYFGGIKLGSGGLVRAYSTSASSALKLTNIKDFNKGYKVEITFNIKNINIIDNALKNIKILNKDFSSNVRYEILIEEKNYNNIYEFLKLYTNSIKIIKEEWV